MQKRLARLSLILILLVSHRFCAANEGMWLPQLLSSLNEKEMKSLGMKINASDIYNINRGSLKDAIVSFGGFCTAEVISNQGLILTNHHCGYGSIQALSSVAHNYLENGFWAKSLEEELPNEGLTATFIVRIDDISDAALKYVTASMSEAERQSAIDKQLAEIRKTVKKESWQDVLIRPFFEGNKYYLFVTETYRDVRLVGTPPSSIGKFGSDTDNWMWPRHTGDFSMFRIYAGKDGKPAAYSKDNVPLKPKYFLPISMKGVKENDFTMVFGFPGRTMEYLPSEAVKQTVEVLDAAKVEMRDAALRVMDGYMRKDEQIKIQYAAKYASTANYWKKWIGEMQGIKRTGGIEKKLNYEKEFNQLLNANPAHKQKYDGILAELNALYKELTPYAEARDYYSELVRNLELFAAADKLFAFLEKAQTQSQLDAQKAGFMGEMKKFYQNYSAQVDRDVAVALLDLYFGKVKSTYIGGEAYQIWMETNKSGAATADKLFAETSLSSYDKLNAFLSQPVADIRGALWKDPATRMALALKKGYIENVSRKINEIQPRINTLQRSYMQAQLDVMGTKRRFYPDANGTLRVTYGKVEGYVPRDGVNYEFKTYLEGVMEKYKPGDYEFDVPQKLIELYEKKDYGRYGENGKMPVCFIASNHTTGGNSGSPALNAYGQLIGLNFDRTWESTMSDINYDPSICRNIMVDIRYVLFIVDKFAGAGHLIREMKLVY